MYLNSLAVGSRRAMLSSLNAIAELLTLGEWDAYALDRSKLRYHHMATVDAAFRQRYASATTNKAIAFKGVKEYICLTYIKTRSDNKYSE